MMKNPRFSIIVPVYNVEEYIDECINSILKQTYKDFELILVDDGSTDDCGKICDTYGKNNSNVKVIHQFNQGPSVARNIGISNSTGTYIIFVDGDDYFYDNNCLRALSKIDNYDVVMYRMVYYYNKSEKIIHLKKYDVSPKNKLDILFQQMIDSTFSVSACNRVVKRELLISNNIYFKEDLLCEDVDWSLKLNLFAQKIKLINSELYVYRQQRMKSTTYSTSKKRINSMYYIIRYWYNYNYNNEKIKEIYLNYLSYQYLILLTLIDKKNCSSDIKTQIYALKNILKYNLNYKVKMGTNLFRIIGMKNGLVVLRIYLKLKNKGIIKL